MAGVLVNPDSSCTADIQIEPVQGVHSDVTSDGPYANKTSEKRCSPDTSAHSTLVWHGKDKIADPDAGGGPGGEIGEEQEVPEVPRARIVRRWPSSADLGLISNGR